LKEQRKVGDNSYLQVPATTVPRADDTAIIQMTAEMVRAAARVHRAALADSRIAIMGEAYMVAS